MNKNGTGVDDFDGDDLRDPALRRALDHAPDCDALPAAHTRDAILKMAHNLAAQPAVASASAASASATRATNGASTDSTASALPWWRRLFGGGGEPRSRMPWNAAFATVLVAAFVTVLWRSEPVPEARLDGEARVGGASAPAAEAPPAPVTATAPEAARDAASPPSVAAEQAPAGAAPQLASPAPSAAPTPASTPAPQAAAPSADQRARVQRESSSAKESARAQALPKQAAPAQAAPPPPAVAEQSEPALAQDERREERAESERRRAYASGAPAAPAAPALRAAPLARQSPDAAALASRGDAQADVSAALREASPGARAKAAPSREAAPSFAALERWTFFSASAGDARRARSDVEGLPALLGAVARSATVADAALDAPVEARLALYRGNVLIAVLEIAGNQVRWTPQPGGTAWVGTPPAQALDALRSALAR